MIREYLLICRFVITGIFRKIPAAWNQGEMGNVVLVPGYTERYVYLTTIGNFLNGLGYKVWTIPNFNSVGSIEAETQKLVDFIKSKGLKNIYIVSHSRGGLIAKNMMDQFPNLASRINKVIAISTPWHGSIFGYLGFNNLHEVKPGSRFLLRLLANKRHLGKIVNIYSIVDNHVIPNRNLALAGAENHKINIVGHTRILECNETLQYLKNTFTSNGKIS